MIDVFSSIDVTYPTSDTCYNSGANHLTNSLYVRWTIHPENGFRNVLAFIGEGTGTGWEIGSNDTTSLPYVYWAVV